jgi:hypothetical protein
MEASKNKNKQNKSVNKDTKTNSLEISEGNAYATAVEKEEIFNKEDLSPMLL